MNYLTENVATLIRIGKESYSTQHYRPIGRITRSPDQNTRIIENYFSDIRGRARPGLLSQMRSANAREVCTIKNLEGYLFL